MHRPSRTVLLSPFLRRPRVSLARGLRAVWRRWYWISLVLALVAPARPVWSDDPATLAVAANFLEPAQVLAKSAEARTGHRYRLVSGSTGKLYAQIRSGAPFNVLLSADRATVQRLIDDGAADPASRFPYAIGQLVLWSRRPDVFPAGGQAFLSDRTLQRLAIASPEVAPYGAAAREVLQRLNRWEALQPKLVTSPSISDVFLQVATGNADAGFIAASSLASRSAEAYRNGSRWDVPAHLHSPIVQDAVALRREPGEAAARAFLHYLQSPEAQATIRSFGYALPAPLAPNPR